MEYIEREAAKRKYCETCNWYGTDLCNGCETPMSRIPTADVAPVRHGRWVKAKGAWCTPGGDPVWECSECGKGRHVYGIEHGSYGGDIADGQWVACPNCGAKMQ